jgi:hypothetical protein
MLALSAERAVESTLAVAAGGFSHRRFSLSGAPVRTDWHTRAAPKWERARTAQGLSPLTFPDPNADHKPEMVTMP